MRTPLDFLGSTPPPPPPPCDIPSGCCSFTGPWTVTRSSLRLLRRVATFCRPLRPVLLLVSFPRSPSPVVGVPGLCWMWRGVPFACQRRPKIGVLRMCWLLPGSFDCFCCPPPPPRSTAGWLIHDTTAKAAGQCLPDTKVSPFWTPDWNAQMHPGHIGFGVSHESSSSSS